MTVSYNLDVSSVSAWNFVRLLIRWRGSIWKCVYSELLLWLVGYYIVMFFYRVVMPEKSARTFEQVAQYFDGRMDYIPLTFMLGFFVTIVIERWRQIFANLGWIENCALTIANLIPGDTEEIVLTRRSIIRYLVLHQVLVYRDISMRVRRRFPNSDAIQKAGFIFEDEVKEIDNIDIVYNKYWAPVNWAMGLCHKMHKDGHLVAPPSLNACLNEIRVFRSNLAILANYDACPLPILYPQVVFLAVRTYFFVCLISRQFLVGPNLPSKYQLNLYFPIMTVLQFIFVLSWMKVAEALLNPLGEDDDDFETNFLIDRNISIGMAIVDKTAGKIPTLKKDIFSDAMYNPVYSADSQKYGSADRTLIGSAATVTLAEPNEKISMVEIDPRKSIDFSQSLRYRPTATMRRRISGALGLKRPSTSQSHSATPMPTDQQMPPSSPPRSPQGKLTLNLAPSRSHTGFELPNGYGSSSPHPPTSPSYSHSNMSALMKVDEEAFERSSSEESVHSIIKAELDPNHASSKKPKEL